MSDATEIPADVTKAIDSAVATRINKAYFTAIASIAVALVSLAGVIYSAWIESDTQAKLKNIEASVQLSELAIRRAERVAEEYEKLLSATEGENKRLAFLNLWHLHSGEEHRRLLLLTGLQFAGKDVFELLQALTPELEEYQDVFAKLSNSRECLEDAQSSRANDCGTNEFAKKLLSKVNPGLTFGLLLQDMAEAPLTSKDNANLDLLRQLIEINPDLVERLHRQYQDVYPDILGLSYLLYQNGIPGPFREVLEGDHTVAEKIKLVEFLSGWPLTDLDASDRRALISLLDDLLDNVVDPWDFAPVFAMVKKVQRHIDDAQRAKFSQRFAALLKDTDVYWSIRSNAAEALAGMDFQTLLETLRELEVAADGNIMSYTLTRTLGKNRNKLGKIYPGTPLPTPEENFNAWQDWIKVVQSG